MILDTEKSKKSTRKLSQLMKDFIKVSGYKIDVQKSIFYTLAVNNPPTKLRRHLHLNAIKFTFAWREIKYKGINSTEEAILIYWKLQNTVERN